VKPGQLSTLSRDLKNPYKVMGLTGGVASGKSLAADYFKEAGMHVIKADDIARALGDEGGAAHGAIMQRFGTNDRMKLRKIVFNDPLALKDLEAILHPLIRAEAIRMMKDIAEKAHGDKKIIIYEAALLVETKHYEDLDGLIVIHSPKDLRKRRLIWRDKITEDLAEKMIASQASDEDRVKVATEVIDNSGTKEQLKAQIEKLAKKLKQTA